MSSTFSGKRYALSIPSFFSIYPHNYMKKPHEHTSIEGIAMRLNDLVVEYGSMNKLSRVTGIHHSTISAWINKEVVPTLHKIRELCRPINVNPAWIMTGELPKTIAHPPPPDDEERAPDSPSARVIPNGDLYRAYDYEGLPIRIKRLARKFGSLSALARASGSNQSTLGKWAKGHGQPLSHRLDEFAEALSSHGINPYWIKYGDLPVNIQEPSPVDELTDALHTIFSQLREHPDQDMGDNPNTKAALERLRTANKQLTMQLSPANVPLYVGTCLMADDGSVTATTVSSVYVPREIIQDVQASTSIFAIMLSDETAEQALEIPLGSMCLVDMEKGTRKETFSPLSIYAVVETPGDRTVKIRSVRRFSDVDRIIGRVLWHWKKH